MFNFSILTTRPGPFAFWQMRALGCVQGVRMIDILAVRKQLQILKPIIVALKIFVVNLKSALNRAVKSLPYSAVYADMFVFTTYARRKISVKMAVQSRFYCARCGIAAPSFAVLNGKRGRYAGVQERRHNGQFCPCLQHFLGFNNLFGSKTFAARYAAHVSKIADFVQRFVTKHRLPVFHSAPFLMWAQSNTIYVKGQI